MKISVIVPSFKPGDYIWECLDSLCKQTLDHKDFEVIIILNGCCEPWKSQIANYITINSATNFRLIQTDEGGVSNARNIGLDNAKGEYIAFIDDDDYVSPNYLKAMLDAAGNNSVVLSDSYAFYDGEPEKEIKNYHPHAVYCKCKDLPKCSLLHARAIFNGPCMKLLQSSFIHSIRFDTSMSVGEDSLFMLAISKNISNIRFADDRAVYYRRYRKNSAFTTSRPISFWIKNCLRLQSRFVKTWFQDPFNYNIPFLCSRLFAPTKLVISHLRGK